MSDSDKHLSQYATSATLSARRGLYDTNIGVSLTDRLEEQLDLAAAKSLLDAGCGYGADVAAFATRYPHLRAVGFDLSEGQINDAQIKAPTAEFFVGDITTFQLERAFDRVLVRHVLHLLDDPALGISNILKHLKPGGRAVFAVHSSKSQPRFAAWRAWFKEKTGVGYSAPSDKLTLENQQELFKNQGRETNFIAAEETIHLTDSEPYIAYIKGQKRWSRGLSQAELELLLAHVRAEIETDIQTQGYFEDASINGVVVIQT